jgi:cytoskeletal protein RodZ
VSLILDALKKLEREKERPERGFLVLSHLPWALGRRRSFTTLAVVLLGAGLAVGGGLGLWIAGRGKAPSVPAAARESPPAASTATPSVAPTASPPAAPSAAPSETAAAPEPSEAVAPAATLTPFEVTVPPPRNSAMPSGDPETGPSSPMPASPASGREPDGKPHAELRLNAITTQDGRPVAVLNDRVVREGDSFDGIRVIRIGEAEVEVEVRGQRKTIRF